MEFVPNLEEARTLLARFPGREIITGRAKTKQGEERRDGF
jgi:hypothetical protein